MISLSRTRMKDFLAMFFLLHIMYTVSDCVNKSVDRTINIKTSVKGMTYC